MLRFFRSFNLTDSISFTCAVLASPYFFVFNLLEFHLAGNLIPGFVFLFLTPLFFRRIGYENLAKVVLICVGSGLLFVYSLLLGKSSGAYLVLIAMVPLPILLLDNKKSIWVWVLSLIPISATYALEAIQYHLYFEQAVLNPSQEATIHSFALSTAFLLVLLSAILFYRSNTKMLTQLTDAYGKITFSNAALEQSHIELQSAFNELKESKQIQEIMSNQAAYSQLVNGVAHEFKNPLHLMRARAEVTLERMDLDEDQKKLGEMVIKQVDRLDSILKPMLVYGRQNMARKRVTFDLKEIVDDLSELAGPRCVKSKIQYVKPDVPAMVFMAYADKDYVFQSVLNVFVNALQFTPQKGRIALSVGKGEYLDPQRNMREGVWIGVQDTGTGISSDKLPYIFDPYSTSKKDPKNVGLGLSIVQRAILENEGRVDVESEVGVGTLFRLWVPVGPDVKKTV